MILWRVLTEVFERGQSSFAELHLIEDYQSLLLDDGLTCDVGQNWNQIIGADVFLKSLVQLGIGLKIEIGDVFVVCAPELQDGVRLTDLSCTLQNKGLAVLVLFPHFQEANDFSIHNATSLKVLSVV